MMKIDHKFVHDFLGTTPGSSFEADQLALANTALPNTLSFLDDMRFADQLNANRHITVVITSKELEKHIAGNKIVVATEDPRYSFYTLLNHIGKLKYVKTPSVISGTAVVHLSAFVSDYNVFIGNNTVIGPNVTILPDVTIGDDCIVQAGAVIGSEGFEYKRTSKGILPVFHDGNVLIRNKVEIGSNTCIDKGFSFRGTLISDHVKMDNLVYIAHAVQIGEGSFIMASAAVTGSVTIGKNVWVSPNTSIAPGVTVGDDAFLSLGAVVTKNVAPGQQVTGNFAIPHDQFLSNFKKSL